MGNRCVVAGGTRHPLFRHFIPERGVYVEEPVRIPIKNGETVGLCLVNERTKRILSESVWGLQEVYAQAA
ncbi:MAG: hypothetical protein HY460_01065 [Parcubacteria group bacterium]|nr:hypothetical protein [Parcubacteria group bacterium]